LKPAISTKATLMSNKANQVVFSSALMASLLDKDEKDVKN
jgi:hypothetical protein